MCTYREDGPIVICGSCREERRLRRQAEREAQRWKELATALELITARQRTEIHTYEAAANRHLPTWLPEVVEAAG